MAGIIPITRINNSVAIDIGIMMEYRGKITTSMSRGARGKPAVADLKNEGRAIMARVLSTKKTKKGMSPMIIRLANVRLEKHLLGTILLWQ